MQVVVTLDCVDTDAQAEFWLAVLEPLGYRRALDAPPYLSLVGSGPAPTLLLQRVPEPKAGKNRMHLDLGIDEPYDLDAEVERVRALGACRVSAELSEHGFRWVVLTDPEGNEFCLYIPPTPRSAG